MGGDLFFCGGGGSCPGENAIGQRPSFKLGRTENRCRVKDDKRIGLVKVLADGHTYERRYIERWLEEHHTSPVSGLELRQKDLFPNHALRNAIEEYFQQVFSAHRRAIRRSLVGVEPQETSRSLNVIHAIAIRPRLHGQT